MLRDIKSYKQGSLSRYCSLYSVINAVRMLGLELPLDKAQEMYDYILEQLYEYGKQVGEPKATSGKQEKYETIVALYAK